MHVYAVMVRCNEVPCVEGVVGSASQKLASEASASR
jgi:hypothetical protein